MIRICSYCKRACAGSNDLPLAFGLPWTKEQIADADKTAPVTHTICKTCFEANFGPVEKERESRAC